MSHRKNFLPKHPNIVKKVATTQNSPSLTSRSNNTQLWQLNNSITSTHHQNHAEHFIKKQQKIVNELQQKLSTIKQKNRSLEDSVKYYDYEKQFNYLHACFEEAKKEETELGDKIKNCEKVQQTTTPEEYYLWQKRKKTDAYNHKMHLTFAENQEERENLKKQCEEYNAKIEEENNQIAVILQDIEKVKFKQTSKSIEDYPTVNQEELEMLKQEHTNLTSTVQYLKDDFQILRSQLNERVQSIQHNLTSTFRNYKNGLIKELQTIRKQIQNSDPSPPTAQEKQANSAECISEYERKMMELQQGLQKQLVQEAASIINSFDWSSFNWQQYATPPETLNQIEKDYNQYLQKQKQLIKIQQTTAQIEQKLRVVTTDSINTQQKNHEIQSAINKILRLSMSLSTK